MTRWLTSSILTAVCLPSCCLTKPPKIETVSLKDSVIAAAKAARESGAESMTYEASVTTTTKGEVSVIIPVGAYSPTFGGSVQTAVGSKVTIKVDTSEASGRTPSGIIYELDTRTLEAQPLR
ncbi:hypothetical protein HAHE_19910 [Haloferula helveola]|uniref:Lipoprotein n=1 Tax=Haloferula helveola TaxID=490095 RepID=A0ABM7R9U6_9BACT|nr:hypothetical protein HAHE_19910 [Haloferula helveola]